MLEKFPFTIQTKIRRVPSYLLLFTQTVNLLIHYYALNLLRDTEILLPLKVRAMHIFIQRWRLQYQLNYRYVSPSFIAAHHNNTCINLHFKKG